MVESAFGRQSSNPNLRLETLIRIRWLAIAGQVAAVFFVAFVLDYDFYLSLCLALIAASAWLNVFLRMRYRASFRLSEYATVILLAYDILQLAALLYLTGGLQNPFAILLIVPVIVSATTQSFWQFVPLGLLAVAASTVLIFFHLPLPWSPGERPELPLTYMIGTWVAITSTLAFTAIYAYRVADEARKLSKALAATELVLQREQHLSALDGLAAAAAHELGTPLSTIALVSKEMLRELPGNSPLHEDAVLLRSQADRCRDILRKLSSLTEEGQSHIGTLALSSLMDEVAAPHRHHGKEIIVEPGRLAQEPQFQRNPAVIHGLGNLVENAVEFASSRVEFTAEWDKDSVRIMIRDDGPGFSDDLLERIGEPFVTSRKRRQKDFGGGLGLGLFIALTLLERSGATLEFDNIDQPGQSGAVITIQWPRSMVDIAAIERMDRIEEKQSQLP